MAGMFSGIKSDRVAAMNDRERRWFNNVKKAVAEADKAYMDGKPEDRCVEEICKAIDTAKTLRRSLLGNGFTKGNNKKYFTAFLEFELPGPERNGLRLSLYDSRTEQNVEYSYSTLVYAIRCMVHENENLNAAEQPDYHVRLDWTLNPEHPYGVILHDGYARLNARRFWLRIREVVTKFIWGLEAMVAVEEGRGYRWDRTIGSIHPE